MSKIKILFLAANPVGTPKLDIDKEIREITIKVRLSDKRDVLKVESVWAVRPDDLLQYLNQFKPQIVHFSGHGSSTGQIILEDEDGHVKPVDAKSLKALFSTLKDNIQVVILNACYSRIQGQAINEVIDFVIGMNNTIGDRAAIVFAASFYRALGFDRTIQEAFDQARTALLLEGIPEEHVPELLIRTEASAQTKLTKVPSVLEESNVPLRIVDICIEEPEYGFPILDVKLRNVGKDVIFLKEIEFEIQKIGRLENPNLCNYKLVPISWNYDVQFDTGRKGVPNVHKVSHSIEPNAVERFTITISQSDGDPVFPTLFYFTIALIYNENNNRIVSKPIILPIPSSINWAGMSVYGFDEKVAQRNLDILKTFSELDGISSNNYKEKFKDIPK